MRESDLPYSFLYKIRDAFNGKKCPVCRVVMMNRTDTKPSRPTVQHNTPITKGGKHEISNISIICHHCNVSIQDETTGKLNNKRVILEWGIILRTRV